MAPRESLVLSRLKEYFGLCIRNDWNDFLQFLKKNGEQLENLKGKGLEILEVSQLDTELLLSIRGLKYEFEDLADIKEDDPHYLSMLLFLQEYFSCEPPSDKKTLLASAIPGGKYGCVLLIKNKAKGELRSLSVGRLNALISLALRKEKIVHHKTFLVFNRTEKKPEEKCVKEVS